jgi:hypothetical protein
MNGEQDASFRAVSDEGIDPDWKADATVRNVLPSFLTIPERESDPEASGGFDHYGLAGVGSSGMTLDPSADRHVLASNLVWVFRGFAIIAGIWGMLNTGDQMYAVGIVREQASELPTEFRRAAQRSASISVFASVLLTIAVVAIPLAVAESLRLLIVIDRHMLAVLQRPHKKND